MNALPVLIIDSEPAQERRRRHQNGRPSACESFIATLNKLAPDLECETAAPVDADLLPAYDFARYRAAFLSGSPLHFYKADAEVRRVIAFAEALFKAGIPSFGSCAGLQIATVVAGGEIGAKEKQEEFGLARGIVPTPVGSSHRLLEGRPYAFDAPSMHNDEVKRLPTTATLLARSVRTHVQSAEIRFDDAIFWGVQYHPELSLGELALALADQTSDALRKDFARSEASFTQHLDRLKSLDNDPERRDLSWQMGIDEQITNFARRTVEIRNFLNAFVLLTPGSAS